MRLKRAQRRSKTRPDLSNVGVLINTYIPAQETRQAAKKADRKLREASREDRKGGMKPNAKRKLETRRDRPHAKSAHLELNHGKTCTIVELI